MLKANHQQLEVNPFIEMLALAETPHSDLNK
jgi:hypothetical protein